MLESALVTVHFSSSRPEECKSLWENENLLALYCGWVFCFTLSANLQHSMRFRLTEKRTDSASVVRKALRINEEQWCYGMNALRMQCVIIWSWPDKHMQIKTNEAFVEREDETWSLEISEINGVHINWGSKRKCFYFSFLLHDGFGEIDLQRKHIKRYKGNVLF